MLHALTHDVILQVDSLGEALRHIWYKPQMMDGDALITLMRQMGELGEGGIQRIRTYSEIVNNQISTTHRVLSTVISLVLRKSPHIRYHQ